MADDFDPQKISFTEPQIEALTFIQQQYNLHGGIPTVQAISERLNRPKETVKKWLNSREFDYVLRYKGIKVDRFDGLLSTQQMQIAEALLNLTDKRSEREKCQEIGITPQQLASWRRDDAFNDYIQKRAQTLFGQADADAYMNIIRNIRAGNLKAAEFYFEMTGKYSRATAGDVNLISFIASLIEILQARIADPALLNQIADDIENLLNRRPVAIEQVAARTIDVPSTPVGVLGATAED